jgi:phosphoribosyl-ATP pyrophosphohydrolase
MKETFPGQKVAIDELISLALVVAKARRNEDHLQPQDTIKAKFYQELTELDDALAHKSHLDALSELADLIYYSVQDYAVSNNEQDLHTTENHLAQKCGITVEQAYTAALAKYRLRAYHPKNFEAENAAIAAALQL